MSVLPIVQWPDARLSEVCAPVGSADLGSLISDMFDTMYAAKGRGLAGPQVGAMLRLCVMDAGWKEGARTPLVMINPEIMPQGDALTIKEMCLSVPEIIVPVSRPESVIARWTDAGGNPKEARFEGVESRIIQHEFDHLEGKLHFDRVSQSTREALEAPYLKALA